MVEKWIKGTQTCELPNGGYVKKIYASRYDGTNNSGYPMKVVYVF